LWYLASACSAVAADTVLLDFETPATGLQAPGVTFDGVQVVEGQVWSSPGKILWTAPTGTQAAFTGGARIKFAIPVVKVSASLSLSFVTVPLARTRGSVTAWLCAYGADQQLIGKATTSLIAAVGEPELLDNFNPALISFAADVPIAEITLDTGDPFDSSGTTFFIDDLTLTVQEQQPLAPPSLRIERNAVGRVLIFKSVPSAQLEQSPELTAPTWQAVPTTSGYLWLQPTNSAMFFRAIR
jgi:hypothetical protein